MVNYFFCVILENLCIKKQDSISSSNRSTPVGGTSFGTGNGVSMETGGKDQAAKGQQLSDLAVTLLTSEVRVQ